MKVMINILCMCTVWGEPLSQTAQSFMPELIYGANRNLTKVPIYCSGQIYVNNNAYHYCPFIDSNVLFDEHVSLCII